MANNNGTMEPFPKTEEKDKPVSLANSFNLLIWKILLLLLLMLIYRLSKEKKKTGTWHMMQKFV